MRTNDGFSSFSEIALKRKPKRGYPVQDAIIELARVSGLPNGIVFKIWNLKGNNFIYETKSKFKQGEIKNLKPYLLMQLKKC